MDLAIETPTLASALAPLANLVALASSLGASDLHLTAGRPPLVRVDSTLCPLGDGVLAERDVETLVRPALGPDEAAQFGTRGAVDFALDLAGGVRARVSLVRRQRRLSACLRLLARNVPDLDALGLPEAVSRLLDLPHGLILVCGATGSGKSTTLAAFIRRLLRDRALHVLTIEDPIEVIHDPGAGLVTQREVGADTPTFADGLRQALRHDPDVVLIGEMRDGETIRAALTVAETGHLVLSTLHSPTTMMAVRRIADAVGADEQGTIRAQLAEVLQAVLAQVLVPGCAPHGMQLASELLLATPAVRALIRDDKAHQLATQLEAGQASTGMQTMAQSLRRLVQQGRILPSIAAQWSVAATRERR